MNTTAEHDLIQEINTGYSDVMVSVLNYFFISLKSM